MHQQEELPPISQVTYINAPPERVYRTLTTAEGWDSWFTQGTTLSARPGGEIRLRWRNFGVDRLSLEDGGPVLAAEPCRSFVFQWSPSSQRTTVTFTLEAHGPGTRVTVEERGYARTDEGLTALLYCATGWGEALTLLKFYLEHGVTYGVVPEQAPRRG